jgi:hypothetical protein
MVLALRITLKHIKKNEHEVTETLFTIITDAGYAFHHLQNKALSEFGQLQ